MEEATVSDYHVYNTWTYPPCYGNVNSNLPVYTIDVSRDGELSVTSVAGQGKNPGTQWQPPMAWKCYTDPVDVEKFLRELLLSLDEGQGDFVHRMNQLFTSATIEEKNKMYSFLFGTAFGALLHTQPGHKPDCDRTDNAYEVFKVIWSSCWTHYYGQ
jgi:hypothetical protein